MNRRGVSAVQRTTLPNPLSCCREAAQPDADQPQLRQASAHSPATFPARRIADAVGMSHGQAQQMRFSTSDEYQAAYLINQAVGELCPAQIWQLRQSAAGYVPPAVS